MALARFQADELLARLVQRAHKVNNSVSPYQVVALVVFGSYLTGRSVLGDLDVAYWIEEKDWESLSYMPEGAKDVSRDAAINYLQAGEHLLSLVPVVEKDLTRRPINVALFEFD